MPKLPFSSLLLLPLAAAACSDDPTTITISTGRAPEAIAYRDGLDGTWQTLTPISTGTYEVDVHGPYMVSVVCSAGDDFIVTTRQVGRTPEDDPELDLECDELPQSTSEVKVKVVQPGRLGFGGIAADSETPNWEVTMGTPAGTFDLIGVSANRIMIRRDVAVSGNVDLGTLDIDEQGVSLVPVELTVSNAATGDIIDALVRVTTAKTDAGWVHTGSPASAKIAPTSFLSGDLRQEVTIFGWKDEGVRMVTRDFRAGDATAFTLPEALEPAQFETASGELVATWDTLPEHDKIILGVYGEQTANNVRSHGLELSQRFVAATGMTSATLETDLPGYEASWRADLGREYLRELGVTSERAGEEAASFLVKIVNAPQEAQARPRALPRTARASRRVAR